MKSLRKTLLWIVAVVLLFAIIAVPAFLRSRVQHSIVLQKATGLAPAETYLAAPRFLPAAGFSASRTAHDDKAVTGAMGALLGDVPRTPDKQVIRTAELALVVKNVEEALEKIRSSTLQMKGEIDQSRIWSDSDRSHEGSLTLRVPAEGLEPALKQLKGVAIKVTTEQITATDVTRAYADNAARMHSLQAEEQQYLQILKQAKSVQDILDVTEHLTEVRTQIEQLQSEINGMSHDIAMSTVAITLTQTAPEGGAFGVWHPLTNARNALRGMVEGLGDWVDAVVAIVIYLPVILLWGVTLGGILWMGWRLVRFARQHRTKNAVA